MINLYSLPNLIVAIYTLSLGAFIFKAGPKVRLNQICFLLTFFSFGWLFCYGLLYSTHDPAKALILGQVGHSFAVVIVPIVYFFVLETLGPYAQKKDKNLAKISVVVAITTVVLVFTCKAYFAGLKERFWGLYPVGGPLIFIYTFWTFFIAARAIYLFNSASSKASRMMNQDDYMRFKYYSLAITVFVMAAVDFLSKSADLTIYPFGYVFVAAFCSLITYGIIRHRILSVEFIIKRSFLYSVLIFLMTFTYLLLIVIGEYLFRSYFGYGSAFTALAASCIFALSFNPLRSRLQKYIDKRFFVLDTEKIVQENARLKEAAEQHDRLRSVATLAAGMAHEIKNPLTSIRTFAEYLPQKYDDPEFRSKFKKIVVDEVDRVNTIVRQLLEFSKPSELVLRRESIVGMLDETLGLLNNDLLKQKIDVVKDYEVRLDIQIDKNQLKQAFLNLFLNSMQAMPHGGTLTVSTRTGKDRKTLTVTVEDTGIGINKEHVPHIFDPFYTTKDGGSGLGLSIVHGIITKHGGKIKVESEPGRGTVFSVSLKSQS